MAAIAPHLKEAALRLAVYFAAAAEHKPNHTIRPTWDEIIGNTGLVRSAIARAIKQLCDPQNNYVTMRAGGARTASRDQINFLDRVRSGSFGEPLSAQNKGDAISAARVDKGTTESAMPVPEARPASTPANMTTTEAVAEIERAAAAPKHAPDAELLQELRSILTCYTLGTAIDTVWEASRQYDSRPSSRA